jgi:hypothetical protein
MSALLCNAFILLSGKGVTVFEPRMSPNFELCRSPASICFSDLVPCFGKFVNSNNERGRGLCEGS